MAEHEVEGAAISIRDSIFCVANMFGVGFRDSTGNFVTITDPDNHPRDASHLTFLSSLKPNTVDPHAPNTVHQLEFPLHLPHNSPSFSVNLSLPSAFVVPNQLSEITFNATLGGLSDNHLDKMSATTLRGMLSTQRNSIYASATSTTSRSLNFSAPNSSTTIMATTKNPKADMFRFLHRTS